MKIVIEIPYYAYGTRGASQYGENLVRALGQVSPQDDFFAFTYFYRDHDKHFARVCHLASKNIQIAVPRWSQTMVKIAERGFGYHLVEKRFLEPNRIDVFHDCNSHPIKRGRIKKVFTNHGIGIGHFGMDARFERCILPQMLDSDFIIAPSQCILDSMLKYYPVDPARAKVVYYGVDHGLFKPTEDQKTIENICREYRLPEKFLLSVGPFQFRDNIEHLLYVMKTRRGHRLFKDVHVVLVGGLEEHGGALVRRVRELGLDDLVHFAGFIPHRDLAIIYSAAVAFVHPSYYEELGAQILEASACGAPILASRTGGIQEAIGNAAVLFNPHQLGELESGLMRVLESDEFRRELGGRALEYSRRFSWEKTAKETLEIYRTAAR